MAGILEFYSVFLPKFNLLKMRLCDAFVAKLRGGVMLPKRVMLRNRGGEEFKVVVSKEGGEVYFGEGWGEFVKKNGLKSGYVLIFRYDGVRTFDVKIYNYFSCEMEFGQDDDDDDVVEISDDDDVDDDGNFGEEDTDEEDDDEDEEGEDSNDEDFGYPEPRVPNSSTRATAGSGQRGHDGPQKRAYRKHDWEDSEAELLVKPGSPYFVAFRSSGQRPNQVQVTKFALRDFSVELDDKIIYRDPRGREYVGKVSRWKTGQIWISAWDRFCNRNHLIETDKCIFELEIGKDRKCSSMLVHIIRKP